jgi:phage terminase Nu1 subunit (DNA packaging protein)
VSSLSLVATNQDDAADTLGIDSRTFQRWLKRGCPGKPRAYIIRDCIAWARENAWSEDAVLIEGATGEETDIKTQYLKERIEKIRRENALADFKIETNAGNLVDANQVRSILNEHSAMIRGALEKLERTYGRDALDMVLEVIEELEQVGLDRAME